MSYEGTVEFLCKNGHYWEQDAHDLLHEDGVERCPECGLPHVWSYDIDETNGIVIMPDGEPAPWTVGYPLEASHLEDVWHTDHLGNKYATQRQVFFVPGKSHHRVPGGADRAPAAGRDMGYASAPTDSGTLGRISAAGVGGRTMSYDISLVEPDGSIADLGSEAPCGGTHVMGGTTKAEFNITYNYAPLLYEYIDPLLGVRWLYGRSGRDTAPRLLEAVLAIPPSPPSIDYWAPTPGNVRAAIKALLDMAIACPDAVWEGD